MSKEIQHSPAPWRNGEHMPNLIFAPHFQHAIVLCTWDGNIIKRNEAMANAKLVRHAPDLYKAVKQLIRDNDSPEQFSDALVSAKDLIKQIEQG